MGRKSREKKLRRQAKAAGEPEITGSGDLRLIQDHVMHFREGVKEAEIALRNLGRHAAITVRAMGDALGDEKVIELAKELVATPPRLETNLYQLRKASVLAHVERAAAEAPLAIDGGLAEASNNIAFFDPIRVTDGLVKTGRVRTKPDRLGCGDVLIIPLEGQPVVPTLLLGEPPEGQETLDMPLQVESGVIFAGPPEASDGPRMGEVRLDPFSTQLDAHLEQGAFRRVAPGHYLARIYLSDSELFIHLVQRDKGVDTPIDPGSIGVPPKMNA